VRRSIITRATSLLAASVVLGAAGCDPGGFGGTNDALIVTDRCNVSGFGVLPDGDLLAGTARGDDTGASGAWMHVSTADGVVLGDAEWILCRVNGAVLGDFGGSARIDGRSGYTFRVGVQDFGAPSPGTWVEGPSETQTVVASRTYRPTRWEDGEATIADRALVTVPEALPVTVGNAGNQWAWLTFQRAETFDVVTCRYRGGASVPNPVRADDIAAGQRYVFERCTGELPGTSEVEAGDRVNVRWTRLRVQTGAHFFPTRDAARTEVAVDLEVTPLLRSAPVRDRYRLAVWDDATGERVLFRDGELAAGDLTIRLLD
jgi:hypothetical protein